MVLQMGRIVYPLIYSVSVWLRTTLVDVGKVESTQNQPDPIYIRGINKQNDMGSVSFSIIVSALKECLETERERESNVRRSINI